MIKPETSLADVEHGHAHFPAPLVMRLRVAGVATVAHLMGMSERSAELHDFTPDDRTTLRRWRGRIRQQLTNQGI